MSVAVKVALADLPTRCCKCGCRIDKGDRYTITMSATYDYAHADCNQTTMLDHVRGTK